MRRIIAIEKASAGPVEASIELDYDLRCRRRAVYQPEGVAPILLDRERPVHLRDGDLLRLDDGAAVAVVSACEHLLEITAPDMAALVRIAWHLGNRHLPTQLCEGKLLIRHDHVIADMLAGLGGVCRPVMAPFDPEGGAYAGGGHAHSGERHRDDHAHGQGHHHHPA